jgi:type II secretory pathway component PulF
MAQPASTPAAFPTAQAWWSSWWGRISLYELETFCQRMGLGLRSGVDILKLFDNESQRGSTRHRRHLQGVRERLAQGESLAEALRSADPYLPPLLLQMVSAGETSGGLERIFQHLSQHYQSLRLARRDFLGQITWPLIQLGIAIAVVCLVIGLLGLIPANPDGLDFDPLGFGLSGIRGVFIFLAILALIASLIGLVVLGVWKNVFACHRWLIPLILPLPILGAVVSNLSLARMTMTLSMLLNAGVDAIRSVREAFLSTGNDYYLQGMPVALEHIQQGQSLATSLDAAGVFPRDFIQGVDVGELSGNETESLEMLTAEYSRRAQQALSQLSVVSGVAIWILIAVFIIALILRMAFQYINLLNSFL